MRTSNLMMGDRLTRFSLGTIFSLLFLAHVDGSAFGAPVIQSHEEITASKKPRPTLRIQTRIGEGPWSSRRAVYPLEGDVVSLRTKRIEGGTPRWYMIFADLTKNYANANHPWADNPYKWTGMDTIHYHRIELDDRKGSWEIRPFEGSAKLWEHIFDWYRDQGRDERTFRFYKPDVGTFWFQVEVEKGKKLLRSHGIEDSNDRGLSRQVTRVSIRGDKVLLGHVTSFHNVPGVFGSILYQSKNYIGADCADVLMTAWSRWRKRPLKTNYNVQAMVGHFTKRVKFEMKGGIPKEPLEWGVDFQPGDFIAVSYSEDGKKYHHVGALWEDANGNGTLDGDDIVIHAGPDPLHLSYLKYGAFDGRVVILKP